MLEEREITDVFVVGLATDFCVGLTAVDAADLGFNTYLVDDCARGVAVDTVAAMKERLAKAGVRLVDSAAVPDLAMHGDRQTRESLLAGDPLISADRRDKSAVRRESVDFDDNTAELAKSFRSPDSEPVGPTPKTKAEIKADLKAAKAAATAAAKKEKEATKLAAKKEKSAAKAVAKK